MNKFLNIGFNNAILTDKIIGIFDINSNQIKTILKQEMIGNVINLSKNKRSRSVILTEGNIYIISAISQRTLLERLG